MNQIKLWLMRRGLALKTLLLFCASTTAEPRELSGTSCEPIVVDFDRAANGTALPPGLYVKDEWQDYGLKLSAKGGLGEQPRLFDTANPTDNDGDGDLDLGAPNERCPGGGPGWGEGGEPDGPGMNCKPLGNVLIIQEQNDKPDVPDDNVDGGIITIEFPENASPFVNEIGILDIDYKTTIVVMQETESGSLNELSFPVPLLGDNSFQTVSINSSNVTRIEIILERSGAVAFVKFCPSKQGPMPSPVEPPTKEPTLSTPTRAPIPPTASPTKAPTNSPTTSPTKAPTKAPTQSPTASPTKTLTGSPTKSSTALPTKAPTQAQVTPTSKPTRAPTSNPTRASIVPTAKPTPLKAPPTDKPSKAPLPTLPPSPLSPFWVEIIPMPPEVSEPGARVVFVIKVMNDGEFPITLTGLMENLPGSEIPLKGCVLPSEPLQPFTSYECMIVVPVTGKEGDVVAVEVVATATLPRGTEEEAFGYTSVEVTGRRSSLSVEMTATPSKVPEPGGDVSWEIVVFNMGGLPVTLTSIMENFPSDVPLRGCQLPSEPIEPLFAYVCTVVTPVSGAAGSYVIAEVITTGTLVDGTVEEVINYFPVEITKVPSASLSLELTASPMEVSEPGADVSWTITVLNDGGLPVTLSSLNEHVRSDVPLRGCQLPVAPLEPSATYTCTTSAAVIGKAGQYVVGEAIVTGTGSDGSVVDAINFFPVKITPRDSAFLRLEMTAIPAKIMEPGGDVSWQITVFNEGLLPITLTSLMEHVPSDLELRGCVLPSAPLKPSTTYECTIVTPVSGRAGDFVIGEAIVKGTLADGSVEQAINYFPVEITGTPGIRIAVAASPLTVTEPGEDVTFHVVVVNTSTDGSAVTITKLRHSLYGDLVCGLPASIQVQSKYSCTFNKFIEGKAGDAEGGVISVHGVDENGNAFKDMTTSTILIIACDCPDNADVDRWNVQPVQSKNNCYNYGMNQLNNMYAQPGYASGHPEFVDADFNCAEIEKRARSDGLKSLANPSTMKCPPASCLVALYVWERWDYHWYRQNDDMSWSHKFASYKATLLDESGNEIGTDLQNADTGLYRFCEFLCTPWDVEISGPYQTLPPNGGSGPNATSVEIEMRLYAGRTNPGWQITDRDEIGFIKEALTGLPTVADPKWQPRLGYTGFRIVSLADLGIPNAQVRDEVIEIQTTGTATSSYFADAKGLEAFLIKAAIERELIETPPY